MGVVSGPCARRGVWWHACSHGAAHVPPPSPCDQGRARLLQMKLMNECLHPLTTDEEFERFRTARLEMVCVCVCVCVCVVATPPPPTHARSLGAGARHGRS